jgi:hypothetical protein
MYLAPKSFWNREVSRLLSEFPVREIRTEATDTEKDLAKNYEWIIRNEFHIIDLKR